MTDERYKKIMADLGMPNSKSLLSALRQVANEAGHESALIERRRCAAAVQDTKDKSGVNEDGQSWLQRAGRSDFIAAIYAV